MIKFIYAYNDDVFNVFLTQEQIDVPIINYDLSTDEIYNFINDINSIDLFATKKCFILSNVLFFQKKTYGIKKDTLTKCISALNNSNYYIYIKLNKELNFKNKSYNNITNQKEYILLKDQKQVTVDLINNFIKEHEVNISSGGLNLLKQNNDNNVLLIINELQKLNAFVNYQKITTQIVEKFGTKTAESNSFILIEYILANKTSKAYDLYQMMLNELQNPVAILGLLSTQIKFIYQVLLHNNQSQEQTAQLLKAHPYRIKMTRNIISKSSPLNITNKYLKIAELDYQVKSGQIPQELIIDYLIN